MNVYPPTTVSIAAEDDAGYRLGNTYVHEAKVMIIGLIGRQQDGVQIVGQTRTLPNGVQIKVGTSDNGVSQMAWAQIIVPKVPVKVPEKRKRLEESNEYIWIGLKLTDGGWPQIPCDWDDEYPIGQLLLWVWEPPDGAEPPEILSGWPTVGIAYSLPVLERPEIPNTTGYGSMLRLPSGAYMIHRRHGYDPGIVSPFTQEEDGDDLWDQVYVMDPAEGESINLRARHDSEPFDAEQWFINAMLATTPTYLMPDDPDYVASDNQPIEREEASPARAIYAPDPDWEPVSGGGADQQPPAMPYLAKVFYHVPKCDEATPAYGRLKIISGKLPYTIVDRYDFVIAQGNWKPRAMMPRGVAFEESDNAGGTIPAGDNAMDYGWSSETWEVRPIWGSFIATKPRTLDGLNEGTLPELSCYAPMAYTARFEFVVTSVNTPEFGGGKYIFANYRELLGFYTTDWGGWQTLANQQPTNRCGDSIFGSPLSVADKWPRMVTGYEIAGFPASGFQTHWIPGRTTELEVPTNGMLFMAESPQLLAHVSEATIWDSNYAAYLCYLPITNEWVEVDPNQDWPGFSARLRSLGYGSVAAMGFAATPSSPIQLY